MTNETRKEVKNLIKILDLNCSVNKFSDTVDWYIISAYQKLSENFIREFKDRVNWNHVSSFQVLSESFIREFKDRVNWGCVFSYQQINEDFKADFYDRFEKHLNKKEKIKIKKILKKRKDEEQISILTKNKLNSIE